MQKRVGDSGPQRARTSAWSEPLALAALLAFLGIGLLLGAFAFEYVGRIKPCELCLGQRLPWPLIAVAAGAAMLGLRPGAPAMLAPTAFAIAAALALWSAYLAGFHAGVEWKWWPGPTACTGDGLTTSTGLSFDPHEIVRCDQIAWSLFGLSLAGYNFLFSLVAIVAACLGATKTFWSVAKTR